MRPRANNLIIVMIVLPVGAALAAPVPTPRPQPCAAALADSLQGPDYVPGLDAQGHPVARADAGAAPVPLPDTVYVPLRGAARSGGRKGRGRGLPPTVAIDGRRLAPLVNPPACPR